MGFPQFLQTISHQIKSGFFQNKNAHQAVVITTRSPRQKLIATAAIALSSSRGLIRIGVVRADTLPAQSSGSGEVLQAC